MHELNGHGHLAPDANVASNDSDVLVYPGRTNISHAAKSIAIAAVGGRERVQGKCIRDEGWWYYATKATKDGMIDSDTRFVRLPEACPRIFITNPIDGKLPF